MSYQKFTTQNNNINQYENINIGNYKIGQLQQCVNSNSKLQFLTNMIQNCQSFSLITKIESQFQYPYTPIQVYKSPKKYISFINRYKQNLERLDKSSCKSCHQKCQILKKHYNKQAFDNICEIRNQDINKYMDQYGWFFHYLNMSKIIFRDLKGCSQSTRICSSEKISKYLLNTLFQKNHPKSTEYFIKSLEQLKDYAQNILKKEKLCEICKIKFICNLKYGSMVTLKKSLIDIQKMTQQQKDNQQKDIFIVFHEIQEWLKTYQNGCESLSQQNFYKKQILQEESFQTVSNKKELKLSQDQLISQQQSQTSKNIMVYKKPQKKESNKIYGLILVNAINQIEKYTLEIQNYLNRTRVFKLPKCLCFFQYLCCSLKVCKVCCQDIDECFYE